MDQKNMLNINYKNIIKTDINYYPVHHYSSSICSRFEWLPFPRHVCNTPPPDSFWPGIVKSKQKKRQMHTWKQNLITNLIRNDEYDTSDLVNMDRPTPNHPRAFSSEKYFTIHCLRYAPMKIGHVYGQINKNRYRFNYGSR